MGMGIQHPTVDKVPLVPALSVKSLGGILYASLIMEAHMAFVDQLAFYHL